jgi:hypothetical protein
MAVPGSFQRIAPRFEHDKKGPERTKVSNYLITLNTNVRFDDKDSELERISQPLYEMAEFIFGTSEHLSEIVEFGIKGTPKGGKTQFVRGHTAAEWDPRWIQAFRVQAGVEVGHNAKGKRLHIHISLKIVHHAFIRLNRNLILEKANQFLSQTDFKFPIKHIDIKVAPPSPEDYLLQ